MSTAVVVSATLVSGCHTVPKAADPAALPTSATAGTTTIVAIQPGGRPASAWDFLGINQAGKAIGGGICSLVSSIQNKLGSRFPGLEPTPPLLAITDPANLGEDAPPAVKAAAEVKAEEDAAPQKVKALRYLARIGCGGCYPQVEQALLDALKDCTEEVRYEAVAAMRKTTGQPCTFCSEKSCCSPKVQEALYEIGEGVDLAGCYTEPSERVRRQARLAMAQCGPIIQPPEFVDEDGAVEGEGETIEGPADAAGVEAAGGVPEEATQLPGPDSAGIPMNNAISLRSFPQRWPD